MAYDIEHDRERHRFTIRLEGGTAHLLYEPAGPDALDYQSTFVPPALRERGIGHALVRHALDYAKQEGKRVIPTCWFVKQVMEE